MACEIDQNTIPVISGTSYLGTLNGFGDNDSYSFTLIENETVTFLVNFSNTGGSLPNATLKLYKIVGSNIISLGTSNLQQHSNTFTYDGLLGDYFFCIESVFGIDYELIMEFTNYDGIIFPRMIAYSGESVDSTLPEKIVDPCDAEVGYELLDGDMPLELIFRSAGIIHGIATEQDCVSENYEAPSWNWKQFSAGIGFTPTAKEYPIKVRAYLIEFPFVYLDRDFKICVHNNWTYDPPDTNNLSRTIYDVSYEDVEIPSKNGLCNPCVETVEIITERTVTLVGRDTEAFKDQIRKMMYEKQCEIRHKITAQDDVYNEPEKKTAIIEALCPKCPDE